MPTLRFDTANSKSRLKRWQRFLPNFLRGGRRREHLSSRIFQPNRSEPIFFTRKRTFILFGSILALALGVGLFYFSGIFNITKISVLRSNLDLPLAEIEATVRKDVFGKNIFFVEAKTLEANLKKIRPEIARAAITKKYPREIVVEVFKYPIVAEVRVGGENIYVNADGYRVYGEKPERDTLVLMFGENVNIDEKTQRIVATEHLTWIGEAINYFFALTNLGTISTVYFPTAREVHLKTEKNFDIWLDLNLDFRPQLNKLTEAGRQLDLKSGKYEYLDLRVRNKIFYKPR